MNTDERSARRARLNRGWRTVALLALVTPAILGVKAAHAWRADHYMSFNWTHSLPYVAFVVDRGADPIVGDYVDFIPPANPYYSDVSFVKLIVAGPGDDVECRGREFYVRDELVAVAKTTSQEGDPLQQGPCGTVPYGSYFVVTPHKDSYDSRYEDIGYVTRDRIRGVARPVV